MKRPPVYKPAQQQSRFEQRRDADERRGSATERGYDARWRKARLIHLAAHPLCVMCAAEGYVEAASLVDHKIPHRGDATLFWDETNWQSLCRRHHDSDKQSQERKDGWGALKV